MSHKAALVLCALALLAHATAAVDFSADNEKAIRDFYNTRTGDNLPWHWKSDSATAALTKQRTACTAGYRCSHCNITEIPCLNVSTYCLHYSSCVPATNQNSCEAPTCECAKGWTTLERKPGSLQCTDDINECLPPAENPCKNGGICTNTLGSYSCTCAAGWAGPDCKFAANCAHATCGPNADCFMVTAALEKYASCRCKPTFSGHPDLGCRPQSSPTVRDATDHTHNWATYGYDPYLVTFDTFQQEMMIGHQDYAIFGYHGGCPVTFCRHRDREAENYFTVVVKNYDCAGVGQPVCIQQVRFDDGHHQVNFSVDYFSPHPKVFINNEKQEISQPINYPPSKPSLFFEPLSVYSGQIKMTTNAGLVLYVTALLGGIADIGDRLNIDLAIPVGQSESWETEGLCGNLNGDKCDELRTPDGTNIPYDCTNPGNSQAAINSWGDEWAMVNQETFPLEFRKCALASGTPGLVTDDDLEWARQMGMCRHLDDPNGVFKDCFPIVNGTLVKQLLTACKRDVGIFRAQPLKLDQASICSQYMQPFAEACRSAELLRSNESKLEWREATGCPAPQCAADERWMTTAPTCLDTCDKPFAQSQCESGNVQEACICKTDESQRTRLVKRGLTCVKYPDECGGVRNGKLVMSKQQMVAYMCEENFMMVKENHVDKWLRRPISCQPHSSCVAKDGVLDCHCDEHYIGDGRLECRLPQQNCADLQKYFNVNTSGLAPKGVWAMDDAEMSVVCDMKTDGGGWTLIQRRLDGESFKKNWTEYQRQFGSLDSGSFWLGLDNIYVLTNNPRSQMQLRIDFLDCDGKETYEMYDYFKLDGPTDNYRMHVSGPSGTAGDALASVHDYDANGCQFTTADRDNDAFPGNCASLYGGAGWWFGYKCSQSNLNGVYYPGCGGSGKIDRIMWYTTGKSYKSVEMKVRPKVYPPIE